MKVVWTICIALLAARDIQAQNEETNPFAISPYATTSNGTPFLAIAILIPEHHHIYADRLAFEVNGVALPTGLPEPRRVADKFSGKERQVFEGNLCTLLPWPDAGSNGTILSIEFQGCSDSECYFPERRQWKLGQTHSIVALTDGPDLPAAGTTSGNWTNGFRVAARASGFLARDKFLSFLDESNAGSHQVEASGMFSGFGMVATLALILAGGLALNLTPCVLPMIPINLAILGAGARGRDRRRSFVLGLAYGTGMALVYGALGLAVVLTGSKFGTLNASPWFNFAIAVIFVILGLAMFDKIVIDFSRFQRAGAAGKSGRSALIGAGAMGSISALLAGACVAPVVISVLLLATTFYQKGNLLGLLFPFVLGVGMALPWPFAAAGLAFLPKPGAWMNRVKYGFGIVIFCFAAWYGWLGCNLAGLIRDRDQLASASGDSIHAIESALEQSRTTGKPLAVDFWASWCKNCEAMEHSTFRDASVRKRLATDFIEVKFRAEQLNDPTIKPLLDQFGVLGLPTYVILVPDSRQTFSVP
jgi:thiol:disulfide interchange protein